METAFEVDLSRRQAYPSCCYQWEGGDRGPMRKVGPTSRAIYRLKYLPTAPKHMLSGG